MAITQFVPELWSAELLHNLQKNLVMSPLVNRNYEGDIKAAGDRVRIVSISRPATKAYTRNTNIAAPDNLTDAQRTLIVDQQYYTNFQIDDIDAAQQAGNLMAEAQVENAYAFADLIDSYLIGLYTDAAAGNKLGATACTSADLVFKMIISLRAKQNAANVPSAGRWLLLPDFCIGWLLQDNRIVANAGMAQSGQNLLAGSVGRILGYDVYESNNLPNTAGDDWLAMAGHPMAITFAEQLTELVPYKPELRFGDALKTLYVYGGKVVYPDALATAECSVG